MKNQKNPKENNKDGCLIGVGIVGFILISLWAQATPFPEAAILIGVIVLGVVLFGLYQGTKK